MTDRSGSAHAEQVRTMFARIAPQYDLINRLMTAGQDRRWRRQVIRLAQLQPGERLLDLGAGTGDLTREALRQQPMARVTAVDFTQQMMKVGQQQGLRNWCAADALQLPFANQTFDAVVSGFLMRNVLDVDLALREQFRLLKSGGCVVILDTTRPQRNLLSPFIQFHLHVVIPALGAILSGSRDAYTYLPDSTERFLSADNLAARMTSAGFRDVRFQVLMFGTIAIHWGERV